MGRDGWLNEKWHDSAKRFAVGLLIQNNAVVSLTRSLPPGNPASTCITAVPAHARDY